MTDVSSPDRRRTFGPVVLVGVAAGVLAAVAANRPWVSGSAGAVDTSAGDELTSVLRLDTFQQSPLAGALALLVLACWGVLLVTRGLFRRGVAVLGALAAVALLVTTVLARGSLHDSLAQALREAAAAPTAQVSVTGWWWVALAASVVVIVASVAAVALVAAWPEMGARYDAPAQGEPSLREPETNLDIWKALDEGHDPTA